MQATTAPPPQTEKKRTFYFSLRFQLLIVFLILFAVVSGGAFAWFRNFAVNTVRNRLEEDLETLLVGVNQETDGDAFEQLIIASQNAPEEGYYPPKPGEEGADEISDLYWAHAQFLYEMRTAIGKDRVRFYTYIPGEENEVIFIGSSSALAEQDGAPFLYHWKPASVSDAEVLLAGAEEKTLYLDIYEDDFGEWISGYMPITNSAGDKVGALGIDFQASYVREVQQNVENGIILATGITAIIVILMVFIVSSVLTRPITALTRVAGHIGEGDYDQDLSKLTSARVSDEIDTLAQVFEIMVSKVARREQKLKQQVAELQILIDDTKRQEQVNEIVDSDFFRDLQSKANKIRRDFAKSGRDPKSTAAPAEEKAAADNPPPDAE